MGDRLRWEQDGWDWPNRQSSRFVTAAGLTWHVQIMGSGPVALLLHGTGASTHSWRDLAPRLADRFTVVAPDLPGQGFTSAPPAHRLSLPGMAGALKALLEELGLQPELGVGHSAGAAILARMCLDGDLDLKGLVSLNGALLPFYGVPGRLFSPAAKLLASSSLVPRLFARRAGEANVVTRLLDDTGSRIDPVGTALYKRLARSPGHVAAALGMMANWDLKPLSRELPRLKPRLLLVVGGNDRTISPLEAVRLDDMVPGAKLVHLRGQGHLAHEEQPKRVAEIVEDFARSARLLPGNAG